jgi:hypothetical protein
VGAVQKLIQLFDSLIEAETAKPTSLLPSSAADSKVAPSVTGSGSGGLTIIENSSEANASTRPTKRTRVDSASQKHTTSSSALSLQVIIQSIGKEIIFQTIGTLLLTASPLLPIDLRTQIERIICSGLLTLQKGILRLSTPPLISAFLFSSSSHASNLDHLTSSSSSNSASNSSTSTSMRSTNKQRIRRLNCESIRSDPCVQNQFLAIAYYEIATCTSDGNRSGNLSILKDVCQLCSQYSETQIQSLDILLHLESLFFPSGGSSSLPLLSQNISSTIFREISSNEENYLINKTIPVIQKQRELVNDFISVTVSGQKRRGEENEQEEVKNSLIGVRVGDADVGVVRLKNELEDNGATSQGPFSMMLERDNDENEGQKQERGQEAIPVKRIPTPTPPLQTLPKMKMPNLRDSQQRVEEESDDDDLPDINLADPDQI